MQTLRKIGLLAATALAALAISAAPAAVAQATGQATGLTEPGYKTPHTGWGVPDLQGFWSNSSFTGMQRPAGATKLVMNEEEAAKLAKINVYTGARKQEAGASKVDAKSSEELLSDKNPSRGYNAFWMDPGQSYAKVKGEYRSSWITNPSDGRIPYSERGIQANTRGSAYDGPESRSLSERCIMSFTGSYGPVIGNGMYNNTLQFVQSPNSVMILAEMIHDARIIPIVKSKADVKHGPAAIPKWGGDGVGWYEGDTLVVETVNSNPKQRSYISPAGKVMERFTRWSNDQILYQFTVEDPTLYKQSWGGEMSLNVSKEPPYEYACHEGNYGLTGILAGARQLEREGRPQPVEKPIFAGVDVSDGE
ncbi:MAG TPA: hypothetical protein VGO52_05335 [Hyphomonadaceae bacterium]|jgi:hypothetical protein|nr:hypothetical protein [Hyphomonadaceae bacterium]